MADEDTRTGTPRGASAHRGSRRAPAARGGDERTNLDDLYWDRGAPYEPYSAAGGGRWYSGETPYGQQFEESESGDSWMQFAAEPLLDRPDRISPTGDFRPYGDDTFARGREDEQTHDQLPGRNLPYGALYGRNLRGWGHRRRPFYAGWRQVREWPEHPPAPGTEGPHAGRGPSGYRRSDPSLHEEVCQRLTRAGWVDASDITVTVEDGEVMLEGTVESRQEKREAENVAWSVLGVHDVHNHLRRRRGPDGPGAPEPSPTPGPSRRR